MSIRQDITWRGHPDHVKPEDEGLHLPPAGADPARLFGDTVWLSAIAPEVGIVGELHFHVCANKNYGRFEALFWIDGVQMIYEGKLVAALEIGQTRWSDGRMTYEVIEPFQKIRVTLDHTRFGFELDYTARHPMFEFKDSVEGDPLEGLQPASGLHGGHFEQAMNVKGHFEIRGGPDAGQIRTIDTFALRDHTWSDRWANTPPWTYPAGQYPLHYWLVLQFPDRHLNATGFYDLSRLGVERGWGRIGGYESTVFGTRPVVACTSSAYGGHPAEPEGNTAPLRWRLEFANGDVYTVRATKIHGVAKLLMLGEDDCESHLDDWETFADLEIEETGERGDGVIEHSMWPPNPRWLV